MVVDIVILSRNDTNISLMGFAAFSNSPRRFHFLSRHQDPQFANCTGSMRGLTVFTDFTKIAIYAATIIERATYFGSGSFSYSMIPYSDSALMILGFGVLSQNPEFGN